MIGDVESPIRHHRGHRRGQEPDRGGPHLRGLPGNGLANWWPDTEPRVNWYELRSVMAEDLVVSENSNLASTCEFVLVDESAQSVASAYLTWMVREMPRDG